MPTLGLELLSRRWKHSGAIIFVESGPQLADRRTGERYPGVDLFGTDTDNKLDPEEVMVT